MALFGKKGLRIEVVDGVDIESGITLSGEKMTVGTGSADTLRLGEADVVPAQVTFQRRGGEWEYFVSDRGHTDVRNGHSRAGKLRAGQEFRLGGSARLAVVRTAAPPPAAGTGSGQGGKEAGEKPQVPLAVALPLIGLVVIGVFFVTSQLRDDAPDAPLLATTRWFVQQSPLDQAVDACLAAGADMAGAPLAARSAPDWAFRTWLSEADKASPTAVAARDELIATVGDTIARAHFLHGDGRNSEASVLLRRLENVIPLGNNDCPILAATRRDLALLEVMGRN